MAVAFQGWQLRKRNNAPPLRLAAGQENGALLDSAARIAEPAALLGDLLANHDRRHQIGRDDSLAAAFPRSIPDAEIHSLSVQAVQPTRVKQVTQTKAWLAEITQYIST